MEFVRDEQPEDEGKRRRSAGARPGAELAAGLEGVLDAVTPSVLQAVLAARLGLARSTVSEMLDRSPTLGTMIDLLAASGIGIRVELGPRNPHDVGPVSYSVALPDLAAVGLPRAFLSDVTPGVVLVAGPDVDLAGRVAAALLDQAADAAAMFAVRAESMYVVTALPKRSWSVVTDAVGAVLAAERQDARVLGFGWDLDEAELVEARAAARMGKRVVVPVVASSAVEAVREYAERLDGDVNVYEDVVGVVHAEVDGTAFGGGFALQFWAPVTAEVRNAFKQLQFARAAALGRRIDAPIGVAFPGWAA
jgi:hypothetical protein